jgi:hypothetical protein
VSHDYVPRRRRYDSEHPPRGGGGIPLFPLILVVVFAGLLLGGLLAHFFSGKGGKSTALVIATPSVRPEVTATFAPAATPTPRATESPSPNPSASVSASPSATPRVTPSLTPSPTNTQVANVATETPRPVASNSSAPVLIITPAPQRSEPPTPTVAPSPTETQEPPVEPGVGGSARATAVVRAYLGALSRGDQSSATSYLASGLPNETFMPGAKITSLRTTPVDGGKYRVAADIATSSGEYFETFTLEPGPQGLMIVEHTAIKPQ